MNQSLHFGTDGIRGNASEHPFTPSALQRLGRALGRWAQETILQHPTILIGQDTRISCEQIKHNLILGLSQHAHVVDGGVLPTPAISHLTQQNNNLHAGIVISASHNPYQDNGIKILNAAGEKIQPADEQKIVDFFTTTAEESNNPDMTNGYSSTTWELARNEYIAYIVNAFPHKFLQGKTVVLDCAHGATSFCAPDIFAQLGALVIPLNTSPNGKNINDECGALHPKQIQQAILQHQAHIGFAFDGDGDRVIASNNRGEIRDGDDILFLLASHAKTPVIVGTVMTNQGLEEALQAKGILLRRVPVGDKHIMQHLDENNLFLGGEASGHIIIKNALPTGDGIFAALTSAQLLNATNSWDFPTFKKYPHVIVNSAVMGKKNLAQEPYASLIDYHSAQLKNGRLLARFSGTENVLRVMAEAPCQEQANQVAHELSHELCKLLNTSVTLT